MTLLPIILALAILAALVIAPLVLFTAMGTATTDPSMPSHGEIP